MTSEKLVKVFLGSVILGILLLWWKSEKITTLEKEIIQSEKTFLQPEVYISSVSLKQGDTLLVKIKSESPLIEVNGSLNSQDLHFFSWEETKKEWIAIEGVSVKENPGIYNLSIDFQNNQVFKKELNISERKFPIESFLVSESLKKEGYTQQKIVEEIVQKERLILEKIFEVSTEKSYFDKSFIYPLKNITVTGAFGSIRKSGDSAIQHLGVDLKANTGTAVYAINNGVARFSQDSKINGKTLIIDHGYGIFSLYCHLNEFKVTEGEEVTKGQIIGFSGNSGYSLAPHLHFAVKINKTSVDPLKFIELTQKEFR